MKNQSFLRRLGFALTGFARALRSEKSFRTQVAAAFVVLAALVWFEASPIWWAVGALTIAAVLAAELVNTAVERLADHLHPERHPEIKAVKDCAAAAVLIASFAAVAVAAAFVYELLT